jgi:hypothetical protein
LFVAAGSRQTVSRNLSFTAARVVSQPFSPTAAASRVPPGKADAGTAGFGGRVFPIRGDRTIASLGAELALNVALQYDVPYLVRVGVGVPVHGREQTSADAAAAYVRVGASF